MKKIFLFSLNIFFIFINASTDVNQTDNIEIYQAYPDIYSKNIVNLTRIQIKDMEEKAQKGSFIHQIALSLFWDSIFSSIRIFVPSEKTEKLDINDKIQLEAINLLVENNLADYKEYEDWDGSQDFRGNSCPLKGCKECHIKDYIVRAFRKEYIWAKFKYKFCKKCCTDRRLTEYR